MCHDIPVLSVGDQLPVGRYPFHSQFQRVINFVGPQGLIAVVTPEIGGGPVNIVVPPERVVAASFLEIRPDAVCWADNTLPVPANAIYDSTYRWQPMDPTVLHERLATVRQVVCQYAPSESLACLLTPDAPIAGFSLFQRTVLQQIQRGIEQWRAGNWAQGASHIKGIGPGLTPSGDDFLCGTILGLHLWQRQTGQTASAATAAIRAIWEAAAGGNIFSNTFLYWAQAGRVFARFQQFLAALQSGQDLETRTRQLLAIGSCSGADLATGLLATIPL